MDAKENAIILIEELLENIKNGKIVVEEVNVREPDEGGSILRADGSLLSMVTELRLSEATASKAEDD